MGVRSDDSGSVEPNQAPPGASDLLRLRAAYEGDFDRINLPAGHVILSNYFSVRDDKIVGLVTINNRPVE
jgi:hypothetical protein